LTPASHFSGMRLFSRVKTSKLCKINFDYKKKAAG